ncbi:MAG: hypothetical protein OXE41_08110 [Gammaproteobacteria bacterium]|nr:hypothetical protein [Gammaproteobacteria bacterium]MCY4219038.1 hypothetical protein [Gammaproteobacteria bacterium]MCY4275341.1 hypothetical protein [Gammaproteobacteria bacterium]
MLKLLGVNLALLAVMPVTSARSKRLISAVPTQACGPFSPGAGMVCAPTCPATSKAISAVVIAANLLRRGGILLKFMGFSFWNARRRKEKVAE